MSAKLKLAEMKLNEAYKLLAKLPIPMEKYTPISSKLIDVKELIRNL